MQVKRVATVVVLLSIVAGAAPAVAADGTLPGGTSLQVDIASPADGAIVESSAPLVVSGTAAVGAATPVKDTTVVYVVDTSLSTGSSAAVNCDGVGGNDSVVSCERQAVLAVNADAAAPTSPVANSGVVTFNTTATARDVDPAAGTQLLTAPGPNIASAIATLAPSGGTSFVAALGATNAVLADAAAQPVKIVVFLSDGADTTGGSVPALPAGTVVKAFAIGAAASCAAGNPSLNAVAAAGAAGSACEPVTDLAVLDDVIGESIAATLDSLEITVDGGTPIPIGNADIDPDLPQTGPASVVFSTSIPALGPGPHQICTTARGTDAGGSGSVTDCVNVDVVQDAVDCGSAPCQLTANDGNVATAAFNGVGITKVVGMRPAETAPGECGGQNCITGFDVLWDDDGGQGVAELTVITSRRFSTPPAKAAVYIDGVKVRATCGGHKKVLPCQKITRTSGGRTKYFVRFASDPGIKFR